ncbi:MAG: helix-turn-helix domain-containing protein [Dissulfurispiraceae bacterium]
MGKTKSFHESFATFFEDPTREGFRELIKTNIGELRFCDFKSEWPEQSAISKHILGMANSGGGCLVIGVDEKDDNTLDPIGLTVLKDKADITNGIKHYLPNPLMDLLDTVDFSFDASEYPKLVGKKFQVLFIGYSLDHLPFVTLKGGSSIRANAIYIRREGITEEANHDELQKIINARVETGYSTQKEIDLKSHLEQLRALFSEISQYRQKGFGIGALSTLTSLFSEPNPNYPQEDFDKFVKRMIDLKKKRIAEELDLGKMHV